jgi:protein-disulfide isomerase
VAVFGLFGCHSSAQPAAPSTSAAIAAGPSDDSAALRAQVQRMDQRLAALEQVIGEMQRGRARAPTPRRPRPDPAKTYAVPIEGAPFLGARHAKITIVEAMEFACPYCERSRSTIKQLLADYRGDIKVVHKHFVVHPQVATIPAQATCAAHRQGAFAQYADLVWDKGYKANRNLGLDNMLRLAAELGLDIPRFKRDMEDPCARIVQRDHADMRRVGTSGTPSFYINGRHLSGARPIHFFKEIIDEELRKANQRIKDGTPVERYYDEWVLSKGEKTM